MKYLRKFFKCQVFMGVTFSGASSSSLSRPRSSFLLLSLPSQSSFGGCLDSPKWRQCQHSLGGYSSITPFTFGSDFPSSIITFSFFAALSSLLANSPGDKEATQLYTLLSVCEVSNRCTVSSHQQTERGDRIHL